MKAIDILMEEHDVVRQVLCTLEALSQAAESGHGVDCAQARLMLEFFRGFTDTCHHGKEERHLFPALAPHGLTAQQGPVAVMLSEHVQGREQVRLLEEAIASVETGAVDAPAELAKLARSYVRLMRDHIDKENQVLFPMAAHLLSAAEQEQLLAAFAAVEHEELGAGVHEKYLGIADVLAGHYGVAKVQRVAGGGCGHNH
jgi:hemerythrin-like domain-containing protein